MRRVSVGDRMRITARTWNAVQDAARTIAEKPTELAGPSPILPPSSAVIVMAQNMSEIDIPRYGACFIVGPLIEPEDNEAEWGSRLALKVRAGNEVAGMEEDPLWQDGDEPFGIATTPIPAGRIGRVCISGITQAIVRLPDASPAYEEARFARLESGSQYIVAGVHGGARILWHDGAEEGERKAIVELGRHEPITAGKILEHDDYGPGVDAYRYLIQLYSPISDGATGLSAPTGREVSAINFFEHSAALRAQHEPDDGPATVLPIPDGTLVSGLSLLPVFWGGSGDRKIQYAFSIMNKFGEP